MKTVEDLVKKYAISKNYYGYGRDGFHCQIHYPELCKIIDEVQRQVRVEPIVMQKIADIEIIDWHKRKFATADHWDVYRKLLEEVDELGEAIARETYGNIELEFGDVEICLIVLANKLRVYKNSAVAKSHAKNLEKVTLKKWAKKSLQNGLTKIGGKQKK